MQATHWRNIWLEGAGGQDAVRTEQWTTYNMRNLISVYKAASY